MKRKLFTLALAGMVAFSFVGTSCGDDDEEETPANTSQKEEQKKDEEKKDEEKKDDQKKDEENNGGTENQGGASTEVEGLALDLSTIWSQFSDVVKNDDGSVTLTMSEGDADWQKGEFGFAIPADKQADNYKKFVIKYKDATAKEGVGCVFHFDSEQVSWINGESANAAKFAFVDGADVQTLTLAPEAGEGNMATVRIFDFGTGNSITIVSVTAVAAE